jgi:phosphoserine phosphatase
MNKNIKLVCTDVDGVIFDIGSSWREFHKRLGTYDLERLENLRRSYLNGKISYLQWAREEVKVWRGIPYSKFEEIIESFPLVLGAQETIEELDKRGYYLVAVSSGGLHRVVEKRLKKLGYDEVYSNDLEEIDGIVTGEFICNVEHHNKHKVLEEVLKRKSLSWENVVAIGDDITDVTLLRKVGLSIAFCPRDFRLVKAADVVIQKRDLREVSAFL